MGMFVEVASVIDRENDPIATAHLALNSAGTLRRFTPFAADAATRLEIAMMVDRTFGRGFDSTFFMKSGEGRKATIKTSPAWPGLVDVETGRTFVNDNRQRIASSHKQVQSPEGCAGLASDAFDTTFALTVALASKTNVLDPAKGEPGSRLDGAIWIPDDGDLSKAVLDNLRIIAASRGLGADVVQDVSACPKL